MLSEGAITVELAVKEVMNALWRMVLMNRVSVSDALKIIGIVRTLLNVINQGPYYEDAFKITVEKKIIIYNAIYMAVAKQLGSKLVTADGKQAAVARELGVEVIFV
ncbi:type II toxin-antitoxin system VapC family toxin [Caldivirga sp.]|uniref:type II toxin-antitoxin system VapC family toxin n=1 Tax=Caldivirga sp. TaxID=2080243 RepID=UPI003D0EC129